ncbi:MAG: hypothetical protein KVP17_000915 [Porospora cf. gigantea B]|uniref:uncharacterized protein n=1 Tax=Porospora cf. gigantea B TaxID=2853592 RepID=UPI003571CBED|nr:MAG: hypothetical protein KVP17_000915 [Porospora cf. gigantea B]
MRITLARTRGLKCLLPLLCDVHSVETAVSSRLQSGESTTGDGLVEEVLNAVREEPWITVNALVGEGANGKVFQVRLKNTDDFVVVKNPSADSRNPTRLTATKRNLTADTSCLMKIDLSHGLEPHPQFTNIVKEKVRALAVNSVGLGPPVYSVCRRKPDRRGRYSEAADFLYLYFLGRVQGVSHQEALHTHLNQLQYGFLLKFTGKASLPGYLPAHGVSLYTTVEKWILPVAAELDRLTKRHSSPPSEYRSRLESRLRKAIQLYKAEAVIRVRNLFLLFHSFLGFAAKLMTMNVRHCDFHELNRFVMTKTLAVMKDGSVDGEVVANLARGLVRGHCLVVSQNFPFVKMSEGQKAVEIELTKKFEKHRMAQVDVVATSPHAWTLIDCAGAVVLEKSQLRKLGGRERVGDVCGCHRHMSPDVIEGLSTRMQREVWLYHGGQYVERMEQNLIGVAMPVEFEYEDFDGQQKSVSSFGKVRLDSSDELFEACFDSPQAAVRSLASWTQRLFQSYNDAVMHCTETNPFMTPVIMHYKKVWRAVGFPEQQHPEMSMGTECRAVVYAYNYILQKIKDFRETYLNPLKGYGMPAKKLSDYGIVFDPPLQTYNSVWNCPPQEAGQQNVVSVERVGPS